jgi:hypothetical protein
VESGDVLQELVMLQIGGVDVDDRRAKDYSSTRQSAMVDVASWDVLRRNVLLDLGVDNLGSWRCTFQAWNEFIDKWKCKL